ncbi:glutathione reductase (NADPH), partial [Monoraphidium neglectum]
MAEEYDLVTLGAGSGGTRASRFAAQYYNAKVACVELPFGFVSSESIGGAGGTCVIRGCVPKKLLVYASAFRDEFDDAVGFGWTAARPPHDWKKLIASKSKEIQRLNGVYVNLLKGAGVDYIEGRCA